MSIREIYNIPQSGKVLLYVGNISENKNQRQMVEAYELLPEAVRKTVWVLFCGGGRLYVTKNPHIVWCGAVERATMADYYREADGVVLLSKSEGFGLSLIEGMHFGVPCAMFRDMDAFADIFDERAVVGIPDRQNKTVVAAMKELITKEWNRDEIKRYSAKFESAAMARNYIKAYQQ